MHWTQHLFFWLAAGLIGACIVLATSSAVKGKNWLLAFLVLSLCTYAGYYFPWLVLDREHLTAAEFGRTLEAVSMVVQLLGLLAWASLICFILALRSGSVAVLQTDAATVPGTAQSRKKLITNLCTGLGSGLFSFAVVFGLPAKSVTEAFIKGFQGAVVGAFIGFIIAKLILFFIKDTQQSGADSEQSSH